MACACCTSVERTTIICPDVTFFVIKQNKMGIVLEIPSCDSTRASSRIKLQGEIQVYGVKQEVSGVIQVKVVCVTLLTAP